MVSLIYLILDNVANVTITKHEQLIDDYDNNDEDTKLVNNLVEVKTESTKSDDNLDKNYKYVSHFASYFLHIF